MSAGPPAVRVVILNWNGGAQVLGAVEAVLRSRWPANRLSVVVVDNASTDGSDVEIERRFPVVDLRRTGSNLGFPGNNAALTDLDGIDYVALVNNDAYVEADWLSPLVAAAEADERIGAVCPKVVFAPRFCEVLIDSLADCSPGTSEAAAAPVAGAPRPAEATVDRGDDTPVVRISGVEVDGIDRWRDTWFGSDDVEPGEHGSGPGRARRNRDAPFRWLAPRATIGIPLCDGARPPVSVRLHLAASRPLEVRLTAAGGLDDGERDGDAEPPATSHRALTVSLGREPVAVDLKVGGAPFDVIQNAGSLLLAGGYGADRGFRQPDRGQFDTPDDVWAWCGGAVLLRRRLLDEVGHFWPPFFLYYEDTDLAWRGRAAGWAYRYEPRSVVRHIHGMSAGEGSAVFEHYNERNRLVVLTRNAPPGMAAAALGRAVVTVASSLRSEVTTSLRARRLPRFAASRRRLVSLAGYGRLLPQLLVERRRLRHRQKVSDAELMRWVRPRSSHPF